MRDAARASIFGEQTADRLDLSGFTLRPTRNTTVPDRDAVRRESEAAGFVSRQAAVAPAAPTDAGPPTLRLPRRRRPGRNIQLNLKVAQNTADRLYQIADRHGWVLGETLERALEALEKAMAAQSGG